MQTAPGLHVEWVDEEAVVLVPTTGELHHLNPQAALVFALIQERGHDLAISELKERFSDQPGFDEELTGLLSDMTDKGLLVT